MCGFPGLCQFVGRQLPSPSLGSASANFAARWPALPILRTLRRSAGAPPPGAQPARRGHGRKSYDAFKEECTRELIPVATSAQSRHVEPTGKAKSVRVMTFETPEGGYVAQLLNSLNENADVNLEWKGKRLHRTLPACSISSAAWGSLLPFDKCHGVTFLLLSASRELHRWAYLASIPR